MSDTNIFIIGMIVIIFFTIGVIYTISEFKKMSEEGNPKEGQNDI